MKRSLYVDFDKYKDANSLSELFAMKHDRDRGENDLGKIIPDNAFSNHEEQVWMYVNLKESVKKEMSQFANSFGFVKHKDTFFWSHPYCACNNPLIVRYTSKIYKIYPSTKEQMSSIHPLSDELNLRTISWEYWDEETLYKDDEFIYVPYRMCNGLITSGMGCSMPDDTGYILHKIPKGTQIEDDSTYVFRGLES